MPGNSKNLLCGYRYDPLDLLFANTAPGQSDARRFYFKDRLATEVQDSLRRSIMQYDHQLLAQRQHQGGTESAQLLVTDQQRCVLNLFEGSPQALSYAVYGHSAPGADLLSLLGFNGERRDPVTGCYLLGNGYRAYNPVLMRFISPDSLSPFDDGGINPYAYCAGDPVNNRDDSGHVFGKLLSKLTERESGGYKYFESNPSLKAFTAFLKEKRRDNQMIKDIGDWLPRNQAKLARQEKSANYYRENREELVNSLSGRDQFGELLFGSEGEKGFLMREIDTTIAKYKKRALHYTNKIATLTGKPIMQINLPQTANQIRK